MSFFSLSNSKGRYRNPNYGSGYYQRKGVIGTMAGLFGSLCSSSGTYHRGYGNPYQPPYPQQPMQQPYPQQPVQQHYPQQPAQTPYPGQTLPSAQQPNLSLSNATCRKCGATVPNGSKFCLECGEKMIEETAFCTACGQSLPANAKFCPGCGAPRR